ncbi:MAG: hypothetical protein MJE68_06895 [Proteobacteria bacterium]|nr:hypothetical protein [Pseudomonadota bacterium]
MYYLTAEGTNSPYLHVKHYLSLDVKSTDVLFESETSDEQHIRKKRKRTHQKRVVKITLRDISEASGEDLNSILNSAKSNRNLYERFKEQLVLEGSIKWRHHDQEKDVCIITDYNGINGNLVPGSFVHVTRQPDSEGNSLISCTCDIYNHLKGILYEKNNPATNEELFPDIDITCMHCRYFSEELENAYYRVQMSNTNLPWGLDQVNKSLQYINDRIQLAGNVIDKGTTKFSVKGEDGTLSFVHISFIGGKCYAKCMGGVCSAELNGKKKLPRLHAITNTPNLCPHMQQIVGQIDYIKSFFPWHFELETQPIEQNQDVPNNDDTGINVPDGNFNTETGLWEYPALTNHLPKEMMDPNLVAQTELRNKFATSGEIDPQSGMRVYHLKPKITDQEGRNRNCPCGATFTEYQEVGTTTLYTRIAPLKCICYELKCSKGTCKIEYTDEAERRGIFFYTTKTAVADEVAWDFVRSVQKMRTSFRGFCSEMSTRYQTNQCPGYQFLSGNTFVGYFFSWLAAFKIDFRKHIDPKCGYNPKVLACDGTHIGVSAKHLNLEHAVTKPDLDYTLKSMHRRAQRALIPNSDDRKFLKYISRKYLGKLKEGEGKTQEEEEILKNHLLETLQKMGDAALTQAIHFYLNVQNSREILQSMAKVFIMLSGDSPMLSVLPFRSHQCVRDVINSVVTTGTVGGRFEELKRYSCEVANLIRTSINTGCVAVNVSFILYVIERIEMLHHTRNRQTPKIDEIPQSYDPRKGVAYYFTETGNQLRKLPAYEELGGKNYDDPPEVESGCTKNYPGVS